MAHTPNADNKKGLSLRSIDLINCATAPDYCLLAINWNPESFFPVVFRIISHTIFSYVWSKDVVRNFFIYIFFKKFLHNVFPFRSATKLLKNGRKRVILRLAHGFIEFGRADHSALYRLRQQSANIHLCKHLERWDFVLSFFFFLILSPLIFCCLQRYSTL